MEKSNLICSEKDKEYAEFWDNYYDPEEAYEFGEKIKKLVRDENLSGLFDLVEGELTSGPRIRIREGQRISQIFFQMIGEKNFT